MKFSISNIDTLSDIAKDIGQIFFAAIFLGPLITGSANWFTLFMGLILSILSWYISILLNNLTKSYGSYD